MNKESGPTEVWAATTEPSRSQLMRTTMMNEGALTPHSNTDHRPLEVEDLPRSATLKALYRSSPHFQHPAKPPKPTQVER
ncbi:hypothetical protein FRB90_009794, partial [Tulasnella sp. 427]